MINKRVLTLRSPAAKLWFRGLLLSGETVTLRGNEYVVVQITEYSWITAVHVELMAIVRLRP